VSCPNEATLAIWLDGELDSEDRRTLEMHLVQCQGCRERVLALRDESDLLADVLLDRDPPATPHPVPAAPARGFAIGLIPAVALVSLFLAAIGWVLESLPGAIDWMNPFQLKGATEMLFKLTFLIRDEAPELLQLGLAVAATAGLSAVLTFAVNALVRRVARPGALCLAALAFATIPSPSEAHFGLHEHDDFDLAAAETHDGTLIVSGGRVNIDGIVDGDLVVFAERLSIRGEVRGNVLSLSETAELGGKITGSAHVGGDRVEVTGRVEGNLYGGAEHLEIAREGEVAGDAFIWTGDGIVEGAVGRDLYLTGRQVELRGRIERNVYAFRNRLTLRDGTRIGGDVNARLRAGEEVDVAAGAEVRGEIHTEELPAPRKMLMERYQSPAFYIFLVVQFVAAFLFGMILHTLAPRLFDNRLTTAGEFFRAMGVGLLGISATPIALLLVALTLVGIPVALFGFACYFAAIYASTTLVGALVGAALVRSDGSGAQQFGLALLAGLAVVIVLAHLPFLGWPVHLVVWFVGAGLLIERIRSAWRLRRAASTI